jgi:RHS repeat-associated protein
VRRCECPGWGGDLFVRQQRNLAGQSDGRVLTYNSKNQNISFNSGGPGALNTDMSYLGLGQTERSIAGGATFKDGPLGLAMHSSGPLSTTNYIRNPDGGLLSLRNGSSSYYYLFDRLGSVVALTDSAGNPVNRYFYDPFGNYLVGTTEGVANPWQYAGGFKDVFSGYYKFGARYYDSKIGRWTQRDPSGQDDNAYAYAGADPVNSVDPSGLAVIDFCEAQLTRCVAGAEGRRKDCLIGCLRYANPSARKLCEYDCWLIYDSTIDFCSKQYQRCIALQNLESVRVRFGPFVFKLPRWCFQYG